MERFFFVPGIEPETVDDLWPALNLACLYDSKSLKESCLTMALNNSDMILNHDGFLQLSPEALSFLLSREVIDVHSEKDVIDVVIAWAQNRIENQQESNLRLELENHGILKHLRLLALPKEDFVTFLTETGREIFTDEELTNVEYNYFSDTCEKFISPLRTERTLEKRIPICGNDYLAVNAENDTIDVTVKIYELPTGVRPVIKTLILPSQINPALVLFDNVSHRTHYNECLLVEMSVCGKVVARGTFYDRIKYSDEINVNLNTFNYAPMYARKYDGIEEDTCYEAKIRIVFKTFGYYPLAVEMKQDCSPVVLKEPCRFVHEFVLTSPKI